MNFILILVLTCSLVEAQQVNKKWARIGLITSSIILNAVGDGLYDDGHKLAAKSFRVASIGSLLAIPVLSGPVGKRKVFKYALSYGLMRFALFDITYNATRRLPLNYVGTTSLQDIMIGGQPALMISTMRLTSIWISIELNNKTL